MRSFTSLLGPAHRALAERLHRLHRSFGTLGEEVRGSVARILAHAVAEAVQATVHTALGGSDSPAYTPRSFAPPRDNRLTLWEEPRRPTWSEPGFRDEEDDRLSRWEPQDPWRPEDEEEEPEPEPPPEPPNQEWRRALAAGFQAASWWLRLRGHVGALAALGVGLLAALAAWLFGPAVVDGAGLVASGVGLLNDNARP
jgi:hypothetical protein